MITYIELKNRYILKNCRLHAEGGLHIGTGIPNADTDAPFIREGERPFVPGSSLRGSMRSTVERIVRTLFGENACCVLFEDNNGHDCVAGNKVKRKSLEQAGEISAEDLESICAICRLFGSTLVASRLKISDAYPVDGASQNLIRRDGVGIDRDTETAQAKIKYDFEVLERGSDFVFEMQLENAEQTDFALTYMLLQEMRHGLDVGGKKSRGLGRTRLTGYEVEYFDEEREYPLSNYLREGMGRMDAATFEDLVRSEFDLYLAGLRT